MKSGSLVRIADQGAWSAANLLVTLQMARVADQREFAAFAASTAVAILSVAGSRAWAVYGPMIAGAKESLPPAETQNLARVLLTTLVTLVASALTVTLLLGIREAPLITICLISSSALVVFDQPRQVLIAIGQLRKSASLALVLLSGAGALVIAAPSNASVSLAVWSVALLTQGALGYAWLWRLVRGSKRSFPGRVDHSWRLTAESVYVGLAGQAAVLLLFASARDDAATGLRLASTLVFAPAFTLVQSIQPLFLRSAATARAGGKPFPRRQVARLQLFVLAVYSASGGAAYLAYKAGLSLPGLAESIPYLIPVGVAASGLLCLDFALTAIRFNRLPSFPFRVKIVTVTLDLLSQFVGLTLAGIKGLVLALLLIAVARLSMTVFLTIRQR